jgi:hypothetical protein
MFSDVICRRNYFYGCLRLGNQCKIPSEQVPVNVSHPGKVQSSTTSSKYKMKKNSRQTRNVQIRFTYTEYFTKGIISPQIIKISQKIVYVIKHFLCLAKMSQKVNVVMLNVYC